MDAKWLHFQSHVHTSIWTFVGSHFGKEYEGKIIIVINYLSKRAYAN